MVSPPADRRGGHSHDYAAGDRLNVAAQTLRKTAPPVRATVGNQREIKRPGIPQFHSGILSAQVLKNFWNFDSPNATHQA